jgi:hypothetical protein
MSTYTHRTIIVPAAFQQLAQGLCAAAAEGDAGKGMFTTGLSVDGSVPATHYISSGYIFDDFAALLPLTTVEPSTEDGEPDTVTERPGNVAFVEGLAAQAGITLPPGAIAALFDAIDVTELEPWAAMVRLGLRIVVQAEAVE